jgi:hypothetical protein
MITKNVIEMRASRGERKSRRRERATVDRKTVSRLVEDKVKSSVSQMGVITQLDKIVVESLDIDSWGRIPVYLVKGHIEAQVKNGLLSTKSGRKSFYATVKAKTGEFLAIHWEPGEILHAKKTD